MKHLKLFLLVFVACLIGNRVYAQQTDEVTLVVSADGPTKDEATKIALRSAIEQAYGTFVSANTTILNDELVKDEIVTISSGNIKNYSEMSSNVMPDGKFFVTLKATVSISKLVSYAQSKGAETEFAGSTFGMNMKMKELNKKNEEIALKNLADQIIALYPSAFSYSLTVSEPKLIPREGLYFEELGGWANLGYPDAWSSLGLPGTYEHYYFSTVKVGIEPNQQMKSIVELILKTVNALALSGDEREEYKKLNIPKESYSIFDNSIYEYKEKKEKNDIIGRICDVDKYTTFNDNNKYFFEFRSDLDSVVTTINHEIIRILNSFQIVDNLGNISKITSWKGGWVRLDDAALHPTSGTNLLSAFANYSNYSIAEGLKKYERYFPVISERYFINRRSINLFDASNRFFFQAFILFPKDEISKYSNFRIEPTPVENTIIDYNVR